MLIAGRMDGFDVRMSWGSHGYGEVAGGCWGKRQRPQQGIRERKIRLRVSFRRTIGRRSYHRVYMRMLLERILCTHGRVRARARLYRAGARERKSEPQPTVPGKQTRPLRRVLIAMLFPAYKPARYLCCTLCGGVGRLDGADVRSARGAHRGGEAACRLKSGRQLAEQGEFVGFILVVLYVHLVTHKSVYLRLNAPHCVVYRSVQA
jgi:hypothetical protein